VTGVDDPPGERRASFGDLRDDEERGVGVVGREPVEQTVERGQPDVGVRQRPVGLPVGREVPERLEVDREDGAGSAHLVPELRDGRCCNYLTRGRSRGTDATGGRALRRSVRI